LGYVTDAQAGSLGEFLYASRARLTPADSEPEGST
jgi:hypothetical protein